MKRRRKTIYLCSAIAAIVGIFAIVWRMLPAEPQLLDRSQIVGPTTDWSIIGSDGESGLTCYYWLNPGEVLHFREREGALQGFRVQLSGPRPDSEMPGVQIPQSSVPLELSADGRLLLWLTEGDPQYVHPRVSVLNSKSD